jgi:hypothetical protein
MAANAVCCLYGGDRLYACIMWPPVVCRLVWARSCTGPTVIDRTVRVCGQCSIWPTVYTGSAMRPAAYARGARIKNWVRFVIRSQNVTRTLTLLLLPLS